MDNIELKKERWRYPRFFTENISENIAAVSGEDAGHITKVLRMRVGDIAVICDGKRTDYLGKLAGFDNGECRFELVERSENLAEPSVRVRLFQAFPKSDKMEFIVQKAVECGASEIVPIFSKRCVSRPDEKALKGKLPRYRKIALEAAKQCGRGIIPTVGEAVDFSQIAGLCPQEHTRVLFYECAEIPLRDAVSDFGKNVDIVIGSEGGFEPNEVEILRNSGFAVASLGKRILRCETAPIAALSILMNLTGNM